MRALSTIAVLPVILMSAVPARAFDYEQLLVQAFGSSDPKDLGGLFFALLGVAALLFFWGALRIGRKRQRRMISSYDGQLQEYSTRLRRNKP